MKAISALSALVVLVGCSSPVASLPDPTQDEAWKAVGALLRASGSSFSSFVGPGQPTQCQKGKMGELEVRSCKVCALTLYVVDNGMANFDAYVRREVFDIAFKRAQSFEQPDISPSNPSLGVWVAIVPFFYDGFLQTSA